MRFSGVAFTQWGLYDSIHQKKDAIEILIFYPNIVKELDIRPQTEILC